MSAGPAVPRWTCWSAWRTTGNLCREVRKFKESRGRERILSYTEEDALLAQLPQLHATIVRLALEVGARLPSELLPLTWDDLDKARLTIPGAIAKNWRTRHLPLSPAMCERLRAMRETSTSRFVFANRDGGPLRRFKVAYFKAVRAAGLGGTKLGIHSLRHSWASRMIGSGADLTLVQQLGGWSSLLMVTRYSHHRPERAVDTTARMLAARGAYPPQSSPQPIAVTSRNA